MSHVGFRATPEERAVIVELQKILGCRSISKTMRKITLEIAKRKRVALPIGAFE